MTIAEFENSIAKYLQSNIQDYEVESLQADILDMVQRAKMNHKGLICVAHSNDTVDYKPFDENQYSYEYEMSFTITMLVNTTRKEMLDLFERVRLLAAYSSIDNYAIRLKRHKISTQKFPHIVEGVHISEVDIVVSGLYYKEEE